jgi:beta-lactamase class A
MRQPALVLALLVPLLATAACGDDDAGTPDGAPALPDGGPLPDARPDSGPAATPAEAELTWVLDALNGAPVDAASVQAHFTSDFLAQVPAAQVVQVFAQLAAVGPWTRVGLEGTPTATQLVAVTTRGDGQTWRIALSTSVAEDDKMKSLLFSAAGDLDPALQTDEAIDAALTALAPKVNLESARIDGSSCTAIHELHPEASLAIGSAFKLYVLAALAHSISDGARGWTDLLAISDEHKSLPSGELQDAPVGTTLPLRTYADKMIAISDNTAADHLLFLVGRAAVEAEVTASGHHDPASLRPFLSTRELFTLKLMLTPAEQDAFVAADETGRRAQLDAFDADPARDPRTFTGVWGAPRRIDSLEWFARPDDLCRLMVELRDLGDTAAAGPVREILAQNPGLIDFRGDFSWIAFKGGSEPGVLELTWLVQRRGDSGYRFLTLAANDGSAGIDVERFLYVAAAARARLAE